MKMKMLFSLVKKDFILAEKYLFIIIAFVIGGPIFLTIKLNEIGFTDGGFISFFITVLFAEYVLFGTVAMAEEKYKGGALLSAMPYTRDVLVEAKYLFALLVFLFCYISYTIVAMFFPLSKLNISTVGISLLILTIFWGIIIPLQYKFGYEKTKYISWIFVFMSPFIFPRTISLLYANNISFNFNSSWRNLLLYILSLIISYISMSISMKIYSQKDL